MVGSIQCRSSPTSAVAAFLARDLEPVGEIVADLASLQRFQHLRSRPAAPAWRGGPARAPPLPAGRGCRAPASAVLSSIFLRSSCASRVSGSAMRFSAARQLRAPPRSSLLAHRMRLGFQRIKGIAVVAAGADMADRLPPGKLRPVRAGRRPSAAPSSLRPPARPPPAPRLPARAAPLHRRRSGPSAVLPARACGCGRAPSGPRIQRRSSAISRPGQQGGEAAVGGVEQMMAFVEDIAQAPFRRRVGGLVGRPASPRRRPARSPAHDWRSRWGHGGRGGWRAR